MSFGTPIGASGIVQRGGVLRRGHLHAALDLAHRVEIVVDGRAVRAAELRLHERVRVFADAVEQAARLRRDGLRARPRCRPDRTTGRTRRAGCLPAAATASACARRAARRAAPCMSSSDGKRVSWPMCARRELVGRDAGVRPMHSGLASATRTTTTCARCRRAARGSRRACCASPRRSSCARDTSRAASRSASS